MKHRRSMAAACSLLAASHAVQARELRDEAQPTGISAQTGESQTGLEDIIVTAQRREQKLQDVPVAITAVTADTALRSGATSTETLSVAVPGLQFSRQALNGAAPFLRGVGSTQAATGSESPVATYVDDIYVASASATAMAFNNIERIEVLKGPQGTLFGRNATGGVVNIHTKRPTQEAAFDFTAGYGNFGIGRAHV